MLNISSYAYLYVFFGKMPMKILGPHVNQVVGVFVVVL